MVIKNHTTLGINPGSKYLGIAVFQGPDLRDWRIKAMKGRWSKEKTDKALNMVLSYIERYGPDVLSIKRLNPSRSSPELDRLSAKITALTEKRNMRIHQFSIKDLESLFSPGKKINKRTLAEIIASEYPILYQELNEEKAHKNQYHIRMFEAVALGAACLRETDDLKKKIIIDFKMNEEKQNKNPGHRSRHKGNGGRGPRRWQDHLSRGGRHQKEDITS